jgi:hypothetical protein
MTFHTTNVKKTYQFKVSVKDEIYDACKIDVPKMVGIGWLQAAPQLGEI